MRKKEATPSGASEWTSAPTGRITPADIQQKEFQVARFGAGYRMREVDEFLDQITDAVSALIAENERLLQTSGSPGAPSAATSSGASIRQPTDDTDRAAVEAFLRREKGFLQNLGGLVQEHAEELRSMVRAARQSVPLAPAATQASATAGEVSEPEAPPEIVEEAGANADPGSVTAADPSSVVSGDEDDGEGEDPQRAAAETAAEEPIRIDDPEPARSGRKDEKEDGSLKELFWGEE
jgi:DivIVA domain-containing protein